MSAYIDLTTNDYPLYIGDIELLGGLSERFASVQETPQPETSNEIIIVKIIRTNAKNV